MAGKTGADAVFRALAHICQVLNAYRSKLDAIIDAAVVADVIPEEAGLIAHDFLAAAQATCLIFAKIAEFNSIQP